MLSFYKKPLIFLLLPLLLLGAMPAHALFEDDEARLAILELRGQRKADQEQMRLLQEQIRLIKDSMLLLQSELVKTQEANANLRGQNENLSHSLGLLRQDLQQQQASIQDWQVKDAEIVTSYDGVEVALSPQEKNLYDSALQAYRERRYEQSLRLLHSYEVLHPLSRLVPAIGFLQGNALFNLNRYQESIDAYSKVLSSDPEQLRASDSMLSIANAQILLKDRKSAKETLKRLVERYPQSEAASDARLLLPKLK